MYETYFQGIIGHGALKKRLIRLVEKDRMPHASVFSGSAGLGKTMMAVAVASALAERPVLNGWNEQTDNPVLADRDEAYYVAPQGSMLKVDQFRQLQSRLILQGRAGKKRICIIDHVETMNAEFANRMLKILEEPPDSVCFILITNQPSLLLPTIRSRCAVFPFEPIGDAEMMQDLVRLRGGRVHDYEQAVAWGGGNAAAVLEYLDGSGTDEGKQAIEFFRIIAEHSCPYAKWLTVSAAMDDEETARTFRWAAVFLRDMIVLRSGADPSLLRLKPYQKEMTAFLPVWTEEGMMTMLRVFGEGMEALSRHVNTRLIWDYICIQCIRAKGGQY